MRSLFDLSKFDAETLKARALTLEMVWSKFKSDRKWPQRKPLLFDLEDAGANLDSVLALRAGVQQSSDEIVALVFDALFEISECRALLSTMPRILHFSAQLFRGRPVYSDRRGDVPHFVSSDLHQFFACAAEAELFEALIQETHCPWLRYSGGNAEVRYYHLGHQQLRYWGVHSIEDILHRVRGLPRAGFGETPTPEQLEILVDASSRVFRDGVWPDGLHYIVERMDLGYVPALLDAMPEGLLRGEFLGRSLDRIELTARAAKWIAPEWRQAIATFARTAAQRYRELRGPDELSVADLAKAGGLSIQQARGAARFVEKERWAFLGGGDDQPPMKIRCNERVRRNSSVTDWESYERLWERERDDIRSHWPVATVPIDPFATVRIEQQLRDPRFEQFQVPGYELIRPMGEGQSGYVFHARRISDGAGVALKALRPTVLVPHDNVADRFHREAAALRKLSVPGVARYQHHGVTTDSRLMPYLVMDLVEGSRLADWSAKQPLRAKMLLFRKVLDTLARIHDASIVHRDVKPANIIVTADDEPILVDFGLAFQIDNRDLRSLTRSSTGTPGYIPPEVLDNPVMSRDPRTDLFACGVLLYELAVGTQPRPGERLGVLNADLTSIDPLQRWATAPLENRIASARQFAAAVDDWLAGRTPIYPREFLA